MATPPQRDQAPAVQKLRVRFAKRDRLRFTSHRDFQRAFERALRRAEIPMAYSQGFTPHPKVSYAGAAPTGAASEAEYLEIAVTEHRDPAEVARLLDAALPPGLDIVAVVEAHDGSLADRLHASVWSIALPGAQRAEVEAAVQAFLAESTVSVERVTKKGVRRLDARAAVVSLHVDEADSPMLRAVIRHETPTVRPEDLVNALREVGDLPAVDMVSTRLSQGPLDETTGAVGDPFGSD